MEVDSTSTPPSHCQSAGTICIKPISTPLPTTPTPGPSHNPTISATPCERCMRHKLACVFKEGGFACIDCQRLKSRCMGVPEEWRRMSSKPPSELIDRAKTPQPLPLKMLKTMKMPKMPRTLLKSRVPTNAIPPPTPSHPKATKSIPSTLDLGQVLSEYIYLLSRQGQAFSSGLRVHSQETNNWGDQDGAFLQLQQANTQLQDQVRDLSYQMLVLKNTVDMLVVGQNGHAAKLESHWLYLQRQVKGPDHSPPDGVPAAPAPTHNSLFGPHPPIPPEAMNKWQLDTVYNMVAFQGSPMANNLSHLPQLHF